MISKAEGKFLRVSPSKVRLVMDLIRGKDASEAQSILLHLNKRPKEYLIKILRSAIANAKVKGFGIDNCMFRRLSVTRDRCGRDLKPLLLAGLHQ